MTYYMGIDSGLSGAVALIDNKGKFIGVKDIPVVAKSSVKAKGKNWISPSLLQNIIHDFRIEDTLVFIENVHAMPGQGVTAMFSMGDSLGVIRAVVTCEKLPIIWTTPQSWKKHFGLQKNKELARTRAIELFPEASTHLSRKKDHGRAEALLIARYGYEKENK